MNDYKKIGIIGGQGPLSTADFYMKVIKYFQDNLEAKRISDYPPMVIMSVPSPDLIGGVSNEELIFDIFADAAKKLERDGCSFIVIACNSVQFLNNRLQKLVSIPIISIAEVTSRYVKDKGYGSVGVLATNTTVNKDIFGEYLRKDDTKVITPNDKDQKIVEEVIFNENAGDISPADKERLLNVMENLKQNGAEAVLLACTELPILVSQKDTDIKLVDCNELYAIEAAKLSASVKR